MHAQRAALLAIRSNAYIYPVLHLDREIKRYRIVHGQILEAASTGHRAADIVTTTAAYTAEIERSFANTRTVDVDPQTLETRPLARRIFMKEPINSRREFCQFSEPRSEPLP